MRLTFFFEALPQSGTEQASASGDGEDRRERQGGKMREGTQEQGGQEREAGREDEGGREPKSREETTGMRMKEKSRGGERGDV